MRMPFYAIIIFCLLTLVPLVTRGGNDEAKRKCELAASIIAKMGLTPFNPGALSREFDRSDHLHIAPVDENTRPLPFRSVGVKGMVDIGHALSKVEVKYQTMLNEMLEKGQLNYSELLELKLLAEGGMPYEDQIQLYLGRASRGEKAPVSSVTGIASSTIAKVMSGEQKPGTKREIRGGHSSAILWDKANYELVGEPVENPNGTLTVHYKKWLVTPENPEGVWSKKKMSSLAPRDWSYNDIEIATSLTVANGQLIKTEVRPGETAYFLRGKVSKPAKGSVPAREIEWEVIVNEQNLVTSSYPTGN